MKRPAPMRMTPATAEARNRAIVKWDFIPDRLPPNDVHSLLFAPLTVGHALQRAAAENA